MRWLESISDSMDMNPSKLQEIMKDRGARCAVHGATESDMSEETNNNNKMRTLTSVFSASASSHAHV